MKTVLTGRTALDIYRLLYSSLYVADGIADMAPSPDGSFATSTPRISFRRLGERECRDAMAGTPEQRSGAGQAWRTLVAIVRAVLAPDTWTPLDTGWLRALVPERPPFCVLVPDCAIRLRAHDVLNRVLAAPLVGGSIVNVHIEVPAGRDPIPSSDLDLRFGPLETESDPSDPDDDVGRRSSGGSHAKPAQLARSAADAVSYDLYLTSPELTYLMLARDAGRGYPALVRLIQLGYELCGHYLMPPTTLVDPTKCNRLNQGKDSFRRLREPLTSHAEIAGYLGSLARYQSHASVTARRHSAANPRSITVLDDSRFPASDTRQDVAASGSHRGESASRGDALGTSRGRTSRTAHASASEAPRVYGVCTAERALKYVLDHSASPVECYVAMLIHLSRPLGGYGIAKPEPNAHVGFSERARTMARKNESYADLLWRDQSGRPIISIEYNSSLHHARVDESVVRADMRRGNAIGEMGIRKIDLTWDQLRVQREFDAYMESIAAQLGQRQRPPSAAMLRRRAMLRVLLLGPTSVPSRQRAAAQAQIARCPCDPF